MHSRRHNGLYNETGEVSMNDTVEAAKKTKTEYLAVNMTDGRTVNFAGKRKVNKETLLDETKIAVDDDTVTMEPGAVSIRMDFRNGETRIISLPLALLAQFAGHGAEQKFGDELATTADKPLSEDDMLLAIDDLNASIQAGKWGKGRAAGGGGVSGASIVVQAIMEATGKDLTFVKAWLQKKLETTEGLTRQALYASFRVSTSKTGQIISRLEAEKAAKTSGLNADEELAGM